MALVWRWRRNNVRMGWMAGVEGASEELRCKKLEMTVDWENLSLCVEMVNGSSLVTAGNLTKAPILD